MKVGIITCSLFLGLLSTSAFSRPSNCNRSPYDRTFDTAKSDRIQELTQKWKKEFRSDCDRQVDFEGIFSTPLSEEGPASRSCKNAGTNAGTEVVIETISNQCSGEGQDAGAEDGRAFGQEYCGIMTTLAPEGDFEISFEETCKEVFVRYANRRCPDKKAKDSHFFDTVDKKCSLN